MLFSIGCVLTIHLRLNRVQFLQENVSKRSDYHQKQSKRVQVPNIAGLWFQNPYPGWYLGPESLHVGYLDSLGVVIAPVVRFFPEVLPPSPGSSRRKESDCNYVLETARSFLNSLS